jgi:hypothetical protein
MIEFRNALSDIVEEFGTDDGGFQVKQRTVLEFLNNLWGLGTEEE